MIDEEATYREFGYYARDLAPRSNKIIIAVCDGCGKIRKSNKDNYSAFCLSCGHKDERHPNFGKHHSEETKRKIGKSRKGDKHPFFGKHLPKETRQKISEAHKGKKHHNWKGGEVICTCLICGKKFRRKQVDVRKGNVQFCSKKCRGISERGENNLRWKGGISFEPYCYKFNDEFKQYVRSKFGNVCFLCGKTEEENGKRLSVHHCNYDKACGCADTEEEKKADDETCQFIPLCNSCNSKVNFNRDYWEKTIKNKMKNKLTGWYI